MLSRLLHDDVIDESSTQWQASGPRAIRGTASRPKLAGNARSVREVGSHPDWQPGAGLDL